MVCVYSCTVAFVCGLGYVATATNESWRQTTCLWLDIELNSCGWFNSLEKSIENKLPQWSEVLRSSLLLSASGERVWEEKRRERERKR